MNSDLVSAWNQILEGGTIPWVLFQFGTCILLPEPQDNLEEQAISLLRQWGPVKAGTPSSNASMTVVRRPPEGCLVDCHHPDILTYVSREESSNLGLLDGLRLHVSGLGKQKRSQDAQLLKVIHVNDPRNHKKQDWGWATKQA